jgi:hypothetical protein
MLAPLGCLQSRCGRFRSQDFGLKLRSWEAHGIGLGVFYSVTEWNADKTRVDRFVIGLQSHACSTESICAGRVWRLDLWRRLDLVMDFQSNILVGYLARFV